MAFQKKVQMSDTSFWSMKHVAGDSELILMAVRNKLKPHNSELGYIEVIYC